MSKTGNRNVVSLYYLIYLESLEWANKTDLGVQRYEILPITISTKFKVQKNKLQNLNFVTAALIKATEVWEITVVGVALNDYENNELLK